MATGGSYGGTRPPGRTVPEFLDPQDRFGALTVLLLQKAGNNDLPNPFIVGLSIERAAGQIENTKSVNDGEKYILRVRNPTQVKSLLAMKTLTDGTIVSVVYHPTLNTCKCVISCPELLKMTEDDILTELTAQKVTEVRRIYRNVNQEKIKTPTLILTLCSTTFPEAIKVGPLYVRTRPYYPGPMLCYHCFKYGHTKSRCPGPARCKTCSDTDPKDDCKKDAYCINCQGGHQPSARKCPVYQKEVEIIKTKIDHNLSYPEARRRVNEGSGSYAKITAQGRIMESDLVNELKKVIAAKDAQIQALTQQMEKMKDFIKTKLVMNQTSLSQHDTLLSPCETVENINHQDETNNSPNEITPGTGLALSRYISVNNGMTTPPKGARKPTDNSRATQKRINVSPLSSPKATPAKQVVLEVEPLRNDDDALWMIECLDDTVAVNQNAVADSFDRQKH